MPTVLVCDDEPVLRSLIRATLGGRYTIVEACDGEEAVEIASAEQPQLILLDMMMPRRTGLEVLEHVRADADLAATPVIMLSARTQEHDRAAADAAGVTHFLPKPFSPSDLAALVEGTLAA